jgi:hypothetical protein
MANEKTPSSEPKKEDQIKPSKVPIKDLIDAAKTPTGKRARTVPMKRTRK